MNALHPLPTLPALADAPEARSMPSADVRPLRVVIVDEGLPYPPNSGKRIRTLNLLLPLATRHRITYLCYPSPDTEETRQAVEFLRDRNIETVLVARPLPVNAGPAFLGRLLWNLLSPLPYSVQVHNTAALRRAIRQYAATHQVDLWQAEWTPYAESLRRTVVEPWVIVAHNVESLIWQRYHETEPNLLKRWYIKRQWRKFERFERRMFAAAPTIAVSDADADLARTRFGACRVDVVENGVDVAAFSPERAEKGTGTFCAQHPEGRSGKRSQSPFPPPPRDPNQILFLGSLDWRPNLDAVALLLDRIFPEVLAQEPSARLLIAGRKPPRWLVERVPNCPNVELRADVPDVRPLLWQCGVMAVPLRIGGGSRLKILEALAAECPVVSTKVGAEGLCLVPGRHFVEVETVDTLAAALVQCLRDPRPALEMARLGRQVVAQQYAWPVLAEKLDAIWRRRVSVPLAQSDRRVGFQPAQPDRSVGFQPAQRDRSVGFPLAQSSASLERV